MASSYRISAADMEAARLVFVMLKDVRPLRKVAIPIMEGMSWDAFNAQTGEQVTSLAQLQDIDQIHVVEVAGHQPGTRYSRKDPVAGKAVGIASSSSPVHTRAAAFADRRTNGGTPSSPGPIHDPADDPRTKYAKKRSAVESLLQRATSLISPQASLPVTMRDSEASARRGRRRQHHKGSCGARSIVLVFGIVLLLVLAMFYIRVLRMEHHLSREGEPARLQGPLLSEEVDAVLKQGAHSRGALAGEAKHVRLAEAGSVRAPTRQHPKVEQAG